MADMKEPVDIFGGLDFKETLYVYEYIKDQKKGPAAERAGVPKSYAQSWAYETHRKPSVQDAIKDAMQIRCEEVKTDAHWVLAELRKLYDVDLQEIITVDESGDPKYDFSLASPELLAALESIDISPGKFGTKIKATLPSKHKLLETIGKHIGVNAFKELIEHSGAVTVVFDDQDKEA